MAELHVLNKARDARLYEAALRVMARHRPQLPRVTFAIFCEECGDLAGRVEAGFSENMATPIIIEHTRLAHPLGVDAVRGD
jgi:hypothetical protein